MSVRVNAGLNGLYLMLAERAAYEGNAEAFNAYVAKYTETLSTVGLLSARAVKAAKALLARIEASGIRAEYSVPTRVVRQRRRGGETAT